MVIQILKTKIEKKIEINLEIFKKIEINLETKNFYFFRNLKFLFFKIRI